MDGQTNADTTAVQTESAAPGGKKKFVPYKKKGIGKVAPSMGAAKVPRSFGQDATVSDGLDFNSIMGRGR